MKIKIVKCSHEYFWYFNQIGRILNIKGESSSIYYVDSESKNEKTILKEDCEIVNEEKKVETKTIKILKDLEIGLKKGEILTEEIEQGIRYTLIKSGKYKQCSISNNCFEYVKVSKNIEKDIELPDEFYFKYYIDKTEYKAVKKEKLYEVYGLKNNEYYCNYETDMIKIFIKNKEWIIIDKPIINECQTKYQKQYFEEQCKKHSDNEMLEKMKKENDNNLKIFIEKPKKFIKLNMVTGFEVNIAKDKIISVVQHGNQTFITTIEVDGNCTVIEKADDIIKMLEE